jgi:DNA-binding SARP family transcriptional activator
VLVCGTEACRRERDEIRDLIEEIGSGGRGVAVIGGASDLQSQWRVVMGDGSSVQKSSADRSADTVVLEGAGVSPIAITPQRIERDDATKIAGILTLARDQDGVDPQTPPYDSLRPDFRSESDIGEQSGLNIARGSGIDVDVLGPVQVRGAARPFSRAWAVELVVYLVVHPNGATNDQWATALWPDRLMAPSSLHSTASAARRSLGSDDEGHDYLPKSHGRLRLAASVGSDWDALRRAAASPDPRAWGWGLQLIRGRPFEGLRSTDWVLLEGILAEIEATIVDLSSRFAEDCFTRGDPASATWAARQGLRVSPYDERLYRVLMRAAEAAGNPAGVEASFHELVSLIAEDVEPFDAVHPETMDLYQRLSRRTGGYRTKQLQESGRRDAIAARAGARVTL